jgi:hypothetical protein
MIFVDAHVHIYDCFDLRVLFNSALSNFNSQALRLTHGKDFAGVLLLAEAAGESWFGRLCEYIEGHPDTGIDAFDDWTFCRTGEGCSLWAQNTKGYGMYLIAGRQIITSEKLEVLALASSGSFKEGASLNEAIKEIRENGALPVLPWGVGKWMGRRKAIIQKALKDINGTEIFLGDNGGRPQLWPRPRLFALAEKKGIKVLPGSDPLPFESESHRVGNFGFSLQGQVMQEAPAEDIKQKLRERATVVQPYGEGQRLFPFIRNQCKIQVAKKNGKGIVAS